MRVELLAAATALALIAGAALAQTTPSPDGAMVYFINIEEGQRVSSPVNIKFGLTGMGIAPFGLTGPNTENTGHHHLIIDSPTPTMGVPIPAEPGKYIHYGRGQTEATVELPPGEHTLQLVLGDALHMPHEPAVMSERITITVE
jgi:hypothetical protein